MFHCEVEEEEEEEEEVFHLFINANIHLPFQSKTLNQVEKISQLRFSQCRKNPNKFLEEDCTFFIAVVLIT